jgi:hypothetical protein
VIDYFTLFGTKKILTPHPFSQKKKILELEGIACFPPSKKIPPPPWPPHPINKKTHIPSTHPTPPGMHPSQNKKPLAPTCILSLLIGHMIFLSTIVCHHFPPRLMARKFKCFFFL